MDTPLSALYEPSADAERDPFVTQWVDPEGGRRRGPLGLALAWLHVCSRPRSFFERGVAPGDQGPGLTFLVSVVAVAQGTRFAVGLDGYPVVAGQPVASGVFWLLAASVLVAPLALHVVAAAQTVLLTAGTDERGGVSETVQVLAYASAPCLLAGVPVPALQAAVGLASVALYVYGIALVHGLSLPRALVLGALPAVTAYGYGFRTVEGVLALWSALPVG